MNYNISETKNLVDVKLSDFPAIDSFNNSDLILIEREGQFYNSTFSKLAQAVQSYVPPKIVGDTINVDGIDALIIAALKDGTWVSDIGTKGTQYIAVDKNHDLSYYAKGSDYVDSDDFDQSPGTFGYEWGGYNTETGIQDTAIGTGLNSTNQLISKNLQPDTSSWYVVWDKVEEFRQSHSDKWFVPSKDELNLVYENKANLTNLSTISGYSYYWSSSENSSTFAWRQYFSQDIFSGQQGFCAKTTHGTRVRLCCLL